MIGCDPERGRPHWEIERGWAGVAFGLYNLRIGPGPSFVKNPAGGLACYDPAPNTIYMSGEALEGTGRLQDNWTTYPRIVSAYLHEVGHALTERTLRTLLHSVNTEVADRPRFEAGVSVLAEGLADRAGYMAWESSDRTPNVCDEYFTYARMERYLLEVTVGDMLADLTNTTAAEAISLIALRSGSGEHINLSNLPIATEDVQEIQMIMDLSKRPASFEDAELIERWLTWADRIDPQTDDDLLTAMRKAMASAAVNMPRETNQKVAEQEERDMQDITVDANADSRSLVVGWARPRLENLYVPTAHGRRLRVKLRERLVHLNSPDIRRVKGWEAVPPGRLSGTRALQKDAVAQFDRFGAEKMEIFRRVDRRPDPMIPLNLALIIDQSGSMSELAAQATEFGWAVSAAVGDIDGSIRVAGMGNDGYPIAIGNDEMQSFSSDGSWENFYAAWQVINPNGEFVNLPGIKVLVIASDMEIISEPQAAYARGVLSELRRKGVKTIVTEPTYSGSATVACKIEDVPDALTRLYEEMRAETR